MPLAIEPIGHVSCALLAFVMVLQGCATAATNGSQRTDCDRGGTRALQRLAAAPEQSERMRRIADDAPVSAKPASSQQLYERWYRVDDAYTRLCRDDHGLGVEIWDFAVSPGDVKLVDRTLLLSLAPSPDPRMNRGNGRRSIRPRAGGGIVFP